MMIKFKILVLIGCISICSFSLAADLDYYDSCTAEYEHMNNSIVAGCSEFAVEKYQKDIEKTLQHIQAQSRKYEQPERYQDILKAQEVWQNFMEVECQNAGNYIGSPMYSYCPMQMYKERSQQLAEYVQ